MRHSLALLGLALLAGFPAAAGATWPGESGRIVYDALDDDDEGARDAVYTIRPDGTGNRRIARRALGDVASSRDGNRIAVFRNERELWQMRRDGSHPRRIVRLKEGSGSDPAWSPSGKRLVFTITVDPLVQDPDGVSFQRLWIVRRDGTGLRKLRGGHDPTWSSRGLIAYAEEDGEVATIHPSGRGRRIWVPQGSPVVVTELDFSPDGRRLGYLQSTRQGTKDSIRTVDLRTSRRTSFRNLTKHVYTFNLAWTPGNHRLAYVHTDVQGNDPPQLRTIRPDGARRKTVFEFPSGLTPVGFAWQTR